MSVSNVLLHFANREGFGLVLLEALSMNLNILASNVGGIPEVLEGTNFNPLSILEKDKARKILNQYLDKNIFYANNIDHIKNKFSSNIRTVSILQILDNLSK